MAYIEPTAETFKIRFPEFGVVDSALVDLVLQDAFSAVGDNWLEKDRARGQMLLTAHMLTMEGEPSRSTSIANGETVNSAAAGPMIELQDRDVKVKLSDTSQQISEYSRLGDVSKAYMTNIYGREYYLLLGRNAPSMVVV